jgi:hypothetical protein
MWKQCLAPLTLLAVAVGTVGAEVRITGELKVPPNRIVRLTADGDITGAGLIWDVSDEDRVDPEEVGNRLLFTGPPGTYKVKLRAIRVKDGKTGIETVRATVVIGEPGPPTPPTPPDPPVPPVPPTPPPSPAPIPVAGFRVLMVYETAEVSKLPAAQQQVLYSKTVRDYLNSKCVPGPDNKTKEYRIYDKDVDLTAEAKLWQEAMKRPRTSVPWLIVSDGKTGYEGPLPANVEDAMTLLKKFGG